MINKQLKTESEQIKLLKQQVDFLTDTVKHMSKEINILTIYVANTPCCTPDRYGSLVFKDDVGGAIGIAEPQFIREARRHGNGFAC